MAHFHVHPAKLKNPCLQASNHAFKALLNEDVRGFPALIACKAKVIAVAHSDFAILGFFSRATIFPKATCIEGWHGSIKNMLVV